MPNFGVNLSLFERKIQKNSKKINKNLNDLKLTFLELALPMPLFWQSLGKSVFSILHDLS